jgi:segregation and condensation protein A
VLKRRTAPQEDLREIFEENFTVADKIDHVLRIIGSGVALKFEEMFPERATRTEIVVTFLAMLELIRMKQLRVRQDQDFGEIWIEQAEGTTPYFTPATGIET